MPFGYAFYAYPFLLAEQQFEERQLMQADDDGMVERFVALQGVKQPRMLSWAELRALRHDRAAWAEFIWPQYARLQDKMDSEEWRRQYVCNWEPPEWCKCGPARVASCNKPHRIGGQCFFGCYTCGLPILGEERYS